MSKGYSEAALDEQPAIELFEELFAAVKPALAAADLEWKHVAVNEAPGFRMLSLLGPDENCLSDIIAELLDPQGSHGQGATFLTLFRSRCGPIARLPSNRVSIHRESRTDFIANQKRRIDILIDGDKWGIGIENKPWAGEQKNQLLDYADDLEKRFGEDFLLIRLTGRDVEPISMEVARKEQLLAQGKFASWKYDIELIKWVNECIQHCQAPRVKSFLDEFSRYITAEFVTAPNPRSDMERKHLLPALESILEKDCTQLHCAAAIAELFPTLRHKVFSKLFNEVQKEVLAALGAGWIMEWNEWNPLESDSASLWCSNKDWRDLYFVELQSQSGVGLVVLGISHDKEKGIERNEKIQQDLKRLGWGKKNGGSWWEGHSPLPEPFTNWTSSAGIAAVVKQRAELKTLLIEEFLKLCRYFEKPLAMLAKAAAPNRLRP